MERLLGDFYAERDTPQEARLYSSKDFVEGGWKVEAGSLKEHYFASIGELKHIPEEAETLLSARQKEMKAFTV